MRQFLLTSSIPLILCGCTYEGRLLEYAELCQSYGEPIAMTAVELSNGEIDVSVPVDTTVRALDDDWTVLTFEVGTGIWPNNESVKWEWPGPELGEFNTADLPGEPILDAQTFNLRFLPENRRLRVQVLAQWYSGRRQSGRLSSCPLATGELERF